MTSDAPPPQLLAELDRAHEDMRNAFRRRDLNAYMALIAPDLAYYNHDGRVLSRDDLARSIGRQLDRLVAAESGFDRETLTVSGGDATESGLQTAQIAIRVFFIFAVRWQVERGGRHTWTLTAGGWQLREVHIEWERIRRTGFGLASQLSQG